MAVITWLENHSKSVQPKSSTHWKVPSLSPNAAQATVIAIMNLFVMLATLGSVSISQFDAHLMTSAWLICNSSTTPYHA